LPATPSLPPSLHPYLLLLLLLAVIQLVPSVPLVIFGRRDGLDVIDLGREGGRERGREGGEGVNVPSPSEEMASAS